MLVVVPTADVVGSFTSSVKRDDVGVCTILGHVPSALMYM